MPTRHTTRSKIADEVDGVVYDSFREVSGMRDGIGERTREREFTKEELEAIYHHLRRGLFFEDVAGPDRWQKPAVRDSVRAIMDSAEYRGFEYDGLDPDDGKPLRARELLTVLTGCKDANENLRWASEEVDA